MAKVPLKLSRFYPIVPDSAWLRRIVPLGAKTVQLRIKDQPASAIVSEAREALRLARTHDCQLILNDYWEVALSVGCDAVHLGQEDLAGTDLAALRAAGIRFGVSTHNEEELAAALLAKPDYVALGPIYPTLLKKMPWAPQGLHRLAEWKSSIGSLPLVAIGGITPERAADVFAAGADSVAIITDFVTHPHPEARVRQWLDLAAGRQPRNI